MTRRFVAPLATMLALASLPAPPALALDLATALARAARSSPLLAGRQAVVEAARRKVGPAGAWESPMLEADLANVPESGRFDEDPMTMKMIGVAQRIPLSGANGLKRGAARSNLAAEAAIAEETRFQVLGAVWQRYADAYYALDRLREADVHRGVMERMVRSARARYESGNGRLDDVLRAEAERARLAADLAAFRSEALAARARLQATMGEPAGSAAESLAAPPMTPAVEASSWLAAAGASHPRLVALAARRESYRAEARAARRMAWPDLELRGTYGFRERLADGTPQDDMFGLGIGLALPVFAGSRQLSEAAGMDAMSRAAEADRRAAELELGAEIEAAWAAAEASRRTVALVTDTVLVTQSRAVDASWASYGAGTVDLWRVLEASHAYYSEELERVSARQDLARAEARLIALTGRTDLLGVSPPGPIGSEP